MLKAMKNGDGVRLPSGATAKVFQMRRDGYVVVRVATGGHAGQLRVVRASRLRLL